MARNSWPSISNINNWRLWIWKNKLLNLINNESNIYTIYLYAKDLPEAKYQFLITRRENAGLSYFNNSIAFIEYSNDMDDIYKNIEEDKIKNEKYWSYSIWLLICLVIKTNIQ